MFHSKRIKNNKKQGGFTFIEMTAVILVVGGLIAFLGSSLLAYVKENRIKTTQYRLEKIKIHLSSFLSFNGHYPCPASFFLDSNNPDYGKEVSTGCNVGNYSGTFLSNEARIGAVPTRALNLPLEYAQDAWGHKFTYVVSGNLATNLLYRADDGKIDILDKSDNVLVSRAHYALVSHGAYSMGAYSSGAGNSPVIPCAASGLESENCNNDNKVRSVQSNEFATDTDFFDDFVYFQGEPSIATTGIPTGSVMPFSTDTCPRGWAHYIKSEGKFIVGYQPDIAVFDQYLFLMNGSSSYNLSMESSNAQGFPETNMPPYVALNFCEKLPE